MPQTLQELDAGPRSVLIVEDSRTVAHTLAHRLREQGLHSSISHSLAGALTLLGGGEFDLVLLDLMLPDVEGLDGLAAIKAVRPGVPVVILTGRDDSALAVEALQAGAQDYLIKGQADTLLLRTLTFACERNRVRLALDRMSAELKEKNEALERVNAEKDALLGMAAHDLRNPLAVIMGISSLLLEELEGPLAPSQVEFLQHIESSSAFMRALIDDLLDISTIGSGRLVLESKEIDLVALIDHNVAMNTRLAAPKAIRLAWIPPARQVLVHADWTRLEQVLNNLISNAVKYSERGTTTAVRLESTDGFVAITVADQGPGIPADEQERLFRPFERASTRSTAGETSTGLGLAIAKKIVDAHGGRIELESSPGQGSTFRVHLPLRQ